MKDVLKFILIDGYLAWVSGIKQYVWVALNRIQTAKYFYLINSEIDINWIIMSVISTFQHLLILYWYF